MARQPTQTPASGAPSAAATGHSAHDVARSLAGEHGIKTYSTARRLVDTFAARIAHDPELWTADSEKFTELGFRTFRQNLMKLLDDMASASVPATITGAYAGGEPLKSGIV